MASYLYFSKKKKNPFYPFLNEIKILFLKFHILKSIFKILGWLFHTAEQLGDKSTREPVAIHYLHKSIELDSSNGQTWYLLGR